MTPQLDDIEVSTVQGNHNHMIHRFVYADVIYTVYAANNGAMTQEILDDLMKPRPVQK